MASITVNSKEKLEQAQNAGVDEIIVEGELAEQVHNGKKIIVIGAAALAIIGASIAAAPFTLGFSMVLAGPIAVSAGVEVSLVLAVLFVGMGLLLAIWKEYDEIEYSGRRLVLRKK